MQASAPTPKRHFPGLQRFTRINKPTFLGKNGTKSRHTKIRPKKGFFFRSCACRATRFARDGLAERPEKVPIVTLL